MCVLLIKPKGERLPSYNTLKACYEANPHGCGYVSTRSSYKSLDFEDFYRHILRVTPDEKCMIHFRLATHGSVRKGNCHPFRDGNVWFAHNGILPIISTHDRTDSEIAFRTIIMPKIKKFGFNSREMIDACNDIRGASRFAIFDRTSNKILTLGNFVERAGIFYSNLNFTYYERKYAW